MRTNQPRTAGAGKRGKETVQSGEAGCGPPIHPHQPVLSPPRPTESRLDGLFTPTPFKGFARRRFTTVPLWWRPLKTEASFLLCKHLAQRIGVFFPLGNIQEEHVHARVWGMEGKDGGRRANVQLSNQLEGEKVRAPFIRTGLPWNTWKPGGYRSLQTSAARTRRPIVTQSIKIPKSKRLHPTRRLFSLLRTSGQISGPAEHSLTWRF